MRQPTRTAGVRLLPRSLVALVALVLACSGEQPDERGNPPAATVTQPSPGAVLSESDVTVELGVRNVTLAPAGTDQPNTAHLHLFINRDLTPEGEVIPAGEGIVHLGMAQSTHVLEGLAPGAYTVIAVLGDHAHVRIAGAVTDTVQFTVR